LAECSERVITDGQQVAVCAYFDTNTENLYLTVPDRLAVPAEAEVAIAPVVTWRVGLR